MHKRPVSVTIICWLMMISSVITLFTATSAMHSHAGQALMAKNPLPPPVQYGLLYGGLLVTLTTGFLMLVGMRFARTIYVTWSFIGYGIGLLTSPMKWALLPGGVVFAVILIFLFLPGANAFFSDSVARKR